MKLRVLERLNQQSDGERSFIQKHQLQDSIAAYVKKLLNTKQGSVPIDPELGVDTRKWVAAIQQPDLLERQFNLLQSHLVKYDPRIQSLQASLMNSFSARTLLQFRLDLTCQDDLKVRLQCQFLSDETFEVIKI